MEDVFAPDRAATEYRRRREQRPERRPDRFALWAVALAVIAMFAGVATADGSSGGITTGGSGGTSSGDTDRSSSSRYVRIWRNYPRRAKRWARRTSECESGGDPKAIGGGGKYRGAFQFLRSTWRTSPRSPGGDPIRYSWRTQAVVAVALKRRDGAGHWPVCG